MTRDAKIGLLLGLVFIFVIAFIINGLPSLRKKTSNEELAGQMVELRDPAHGIVNPQRRAREVDYSIHPNRREVPRMHEVSQVPVPVTGEEDIRFSLPLPQRPSGTVVQQIEPLSEEPVATTAQGPVRVVHSPSSITPAASVPPSKPGAGANVPRPRVQAPKPARPKVYVVRENDNLARIAQNFYGTKEGNRQININRIYKANRQILKSPDEIYVGQKLMIPPLPVLRPAKGTVGNILPAELFEKTESIGKDRLGSRKRQVPAKQPNPAAKKYRVYVVREGDSLWKIAAEKLGNPSRYKELARLNAGILKDEDHVAVGMRLRIPRR